MFLSRLWKLLTAVYLFTQNYTQTAIACGDNKSFISTKKINKFKNDFFFYKTDYGKMLKYREKYR